MTEQPPEPVPGPVTNNVQASDRAIGIAAWSAELHFHQYGQIGSRLLSDNEIKATAGFPAHQETPLPPTAAGGVVVLCGRRRTGRRTAALQVLSKFRAAAPSGTVPRLQEIIPRWARPDVDLLPVIQSTGWLLDMSDADDQIDAQSAETGKPTWVFGRDLVDYSKKLTDVGSLLVITVTPEIWSDAQPQTKAMTFPWKAPRAVDVIITHLREIPHGSDRISWLNEGTSLADLLASSELAPADAVDVARFMAQENTTEAKVADALQQWSTMLRQWFKEHNNPFDRAVLIASAALGVVPQQEIVDAADELTKITREGGGGETLLGAPDLVERLSALPTDIERNPVDINLRHPGLDVAIMDWVWRQRPKAQSAIQEWLVGLAVGEDNLSQRRLARISTMIAAHVTRRDHSLSGLLDFVKTTAAAGGNSHELAVRVLDELVLDPAVGSATRAKLLSWSSSKNTTQLGLVASVCGRRLGRERTTIALLRLSNVLANAAATDDVRQFAGQAMRELAGNPELRPSILLGVGRLFDVSPAAGATAFLELAVGANMELGSVLVTDAKDDLDLRDELADMWKQTREQVGAQRCGEAMASWFRAVDDSALDSATVLDILMPAIREDHDISLAAVSIRGRSDRIVKQVIAELRDFDMKRPRRA